jgi:hypothetical protein
MNPIHGNYEDHMSETLTMQEMEKALHSLKKRKSPGKDGITNEMLIRLGSKA